MKDPDNLEMKVWNPRMVTVSFTDGTRDMQLQLPANCGPTLPETVTVHSVPPREYVRVYGTLYTPKK